MSVDERLSPSPLDASEHWKLLHDYDAVFKVHPDVVLTPALIKTVKEALGSRLLDLKYNNDANVICIKYNPQCAFDLVLKGPLMQDKAAGESFRRIWGEKAELRKFKDNSIREVVQVASGNHDRHLAIETALKTLLAVNNPKGQLVREDDILAWSSASLFDQVTQDYQSNAVEEAFIKLKAMVEGVPGQLLQHKTITRMQPVYPAYWHGSSDHTRFKKSENKENEDFHFLDRAVPEYCPVHTVFLDVSCPPADAWPESGSAAHVAAHVSFLLDLQRALKQLPSLIATSPQPLLDMSVEGVVFRLIFGIQQEQESDKNNRARKHALECRGAFDRWPVFGPLCRLVKRWLSAQLFPVTALNEPLIERSILETFDVHLDEKDNGDKFNNLAWSVSGAFVKWLHWISLNNGSLAEDSLYSGSKRCRLMAQVTLGLLSRAMAKDVSEMHFLFEPCLDDYDALLHLNITVQSRRPQNNLDNETAGIVQRKLAVLERFGKTSGGLAKKLPGFDSTAVLLGDLQTAYPSVRFYHDLIGASSFIAVRLPEEDLVKCKNMLKNIMEGPAALGMIDRFEWLRKL